jgi:hypothetical protein
MLIRSLSWTVIRHLSGFPYQGNLHSLILKNCKMKINLVLLLNLFLAAFIVSGGRVSLHGQDAGSSLPSPESHFGFTPGDDRMLFNYEQMMDYMSILEKLSPKVKIEQIGHSEMGRPMYLLLVSSKENIAGIDRLREINRRLALEPLIPGEERKRLTEEGKVFFLMTLSMHANEVGPVQAMPLIVHELITSDDPQIRKILENTVYMVIPHNPDGMNMIVENYLKYKGTRYEGSSMPGVYHKYVGHNINRDFITLAMSENDAVSRVFSKQWFPQLSVERHQMGYTGPRYYISPPSDPLAENILPSLWNWKRIFGSRALTAMTDAGLSGVSVNYLFDMYWPGNTSTSLWKGVVAMLSEAAGVDIASPVYIEPGELSVTGKGLAEYDISINMPDPWPGGWWRLGDIVKYERVNTLSYLYTAAIHREEILIHRNEITRKEVERGASSAPYYYILPLEQHDQSELADLVNLLYEHGVNSYRLLNEHIIGNRVFGPGDIIVPLAQPFRSFIKEVMEAQKFPVRHFSAGGDMIRPYDITSWSLPLHKGVEAIEINTRYEIPVSDMGPTVIPFTVSGNRPAKYSGAVFTSTNNESYKAAFMAREMGMKVSRLTSDMNIQGTRVPAGSFFIASHRNLNGLLDKLTVQPLFTETPPAGTTEMDVPRIALVESWFHDMDAGWTRYLFDAYHIPYSVLRPADLKETKLTGRFDVIIFPDQSQAALMSGKGGSPGNPTITRYPPEYARGMEKEGLNNLLLFIDKGGKVISWGRSTELFLGNLAIEEDKEVKQEFSLPVRNIAGRLAEQGLDVTGSFLRVRLRQDHPLTFGMPEYSGVFHRGNPVFTTSSPFFDTDRRVIATFPDDKILMSGFIENERLIRDRAALVWVRKGKGELVLFSFSPQFRGSTPATYKLLFNSLLME